MIQLRPLTNGGLNIKDRVVEALKKSELNLIVDDYWEQLEIEDLNQIIVENPDSGEQDEVEDTINQYSDRYVVEDSTAGNYIDLVSEISGLRAELQSGLNDLANILRSRDQPQTEQADSVNSQKSDAELSISYPEFKRDYDALKKDLDNVITEKNDTQRMLERAQGQIERIKNWDDSSVLVGDMAQEFFPKLELIRDSEYLLASKRFSARSNILGILNLLNAGKNSITRNPAKVELLVGTRLTLRLVHETTADCTSVTREEKSEF